MARLDCSSAHAVLASFGEALGRDLHDIEDALRRLDPSDCPTGVDPEAHLAARFRAAHGLSPADVPFSGAVFHHGTRTLDPSAYCRRGLLPLPEIVDDLWDGLYSLIASDVTRAEWLDVRRQMEFGGRGRNAHLYRLRLAHVRDHGPFGFLVRDQAIHAPAPSVVYLRMPETVEDIVIEAEAVLAGLKLRDRFREAAVPCVVSFEVPCPAWAVGPGIVYAFRALTQGDVGGLSWSFDAGGARIPPDRIIRVDAEERAPAALRRDQ